MTNNAKGIAPYKIYKLIPLFLIILGIFLYFHFGWHTLFTFESLKDHHESLKSMVHNHPLFFGLVAVLFFILITTFCLPITLITSLAIGYLFPFPISTLMVVFSATCGGTLLFLSARAGITDPLFPHYHHYILKLEKDMDRYGQLYLIMIRFIPFVPFWMVNLICALLNVSLRRFIWTTLIGIIPGSAIYTYAGDSLMLLFDSHDKLSLTTFYIPQILIGFTTLIAFILLTILTQKHKHRRFR